MLGSGHAEIAHIDHACIFILSAMIYSTCSVSQGQSEINWIKITKLHRVEYPH